MYLRTRYSMKQLAYESGVLYAYRSVKAKGAILARISKILNPIISEYKSQLPEGWDFWNSLGEPTPGLMILMVIPEFNNQEYPPDDLSRETGDSVNSITLQLLDELTQTVEGLGLVITETKKLKSHGITEITLSFRYPYGVTDAKPVYDALYRVLKSPVHDVYESSDQLEVYMACWDTQTIESDLDKLKVWADKNGFTVSADPIKSNQYNVNYIKDRDSWIKENLDKFEITDSGKGYNLFTQYSCSAYLTQ